MVPLFGLIFPCRCGKGNSRWHNPNFWSKVVVWTRDGTHPAIKSLCLPLPGSHCWSWWGGCSCSPRFLWPFSARSRLRGKWAVSYTVCVIKCVVPIKMWMMLILVTAPHYALSLSAYFHQEADKTLGNVGFHTLLSLPLSDLHNLTLLLIFL